MARAAPQSQPFSRTSSNSSRNSRGSNSSSVGDSGRNIANPSSSAGGGDANNRKVTSTSILPSILAFPLVLIHMIYSVIISLIKIPFSVSTKSKSSSNDAEQKDGEEKQKDIVDIPALMNDDNVDIDAIKAAMSKEADFHDDYLTVQASPALTTLLDDALYKAYQAELVPTVAAASQLLTTFIEMKEAAALLLRECRWMVGVPMSGGLSVAKLEEEGGGAIEVAVPFFTSEGEIAEGEGANIEYATSTISDVTAEQMSAEEMIRWNEFDTIQDFAQQCYVGANEAIQRLTTDRLAESANLTLHDIIISESEASGGQNSSSDGLQQQSSQTQQTQSSSASITLSSPADAGIGRCYHSQPRRTCWESPRLYCPDYNWADDAIGACQRLLKTLSKHRFITLVNTNGWDRYSVIKPKAIDSKHENVRHINAPTYASCTPHVFPSLEAVHSLQFLVSELLPISIPSRLNQFRAAVESNAVVSKRLYLVKCEYRAPLRALWESYMSLNAAPKVELVERYLREYHGVKLGGKAGGSDSSNSITEIASGSKSSSLRRKGSTEAVSKKSAIQQQREKLEKLITEKYFKHPAFVEALQLERCCERMELEMSQMLLPLANLASEIMNQWKGRVTYVTVVDSSDHDEEENKGDDEGSDDDSSQDEEVNVLLDWKDVPFMRELLRRLQSILRRKPDLGESSSIRPLLLDLQGVPRHNKDPIDSSIELTFYPQETKPSFFDWSGPKNQDEKEADEWFYLEHFLSEVDTLFELLSIPNIPFLIGSKGDKNTLLDLIEQCQDVWDEDMFRAQYQDWFDMVKRQQELNSGEGNIKTADSTEDESPVSLSKLSETIREAEIELSIAMASKDQLERVHKRLEALRADKTVRYKVLRHIVYDIGYRELNDGILVEPPADDATVEFPKLSEPGLFGDQLVMSGEVLPVG